jgi:hypothetical protein
MSGMRFDLPRSMTERNQQDVDLATQTLEFLDKIDANRAQQATDMRSLVVNLCDMQVRRFEFPFLFSKLTRARLTRRASPRRWRCPLVATTATRSTT